MKTRLSGIVGGAAMVAVAVLGGCSTVGHLVRTTPQAGQGAAQLAADEAACEAEARPGQPERVRVYTACMIARGYSATLAAPAGGRGGDVWLDVARRTPRAAALIRQDLDACEAAGKAAPLTPRERILTTVLDAAVLPGAGLLVDGDQADSNRVVDAVRACLEPRGYTVAPWAPWSNVAPEHRPR